MDSQETENAEATFLKQRHRTMGLERLDSAREEGRVGGRRPKLSDQQQSEIRKMITKGDKTAADAARLFNVHPATDPSKVGWIIECGRTENWRIWATTLEDSTFYQCVILRPV